MSFTNLVPVDNFETPSKKTKPFILVQFRNKDGSSER